MSSSQLWASVLWAPTFIGVSCIRRDNDKKHMYHLILKRAIRARPTHRRNIRTGRSFQSGGRESRNMGGNEMDARTRSFEGFQLFRGMRVWGAILATTVGILAGAP